MRSVAGSKNKLLIWLDSHKVIILLLFIFFALRIYQIETNLPNVYWHDENNFVETALRFGTGNLEPHTLKHGMLLPLILFSEYGAYYSIKKIAVPNYSSQRFLADYVDNPTVFYLISRLTVMVFGLGSILLVYLIATLLYNKIVANLSALVYGLSFVPFIQSKWTKADMVSVFFILSAFLMISIAFFKAQKNNLNKIVYYYILSGFFLGLATAAKLYAIFGFTFIFLAHSLAYRFSHQKKGLAGHIVYFFDIKLILSGAFFIIGFILSNFYILINPIFFLNNLSELHKELINPGSTYPWLMYLKYHLKNVFGSMGLAILSLTAYVYFVFKRSKKAYLLLSYPLVLYLVYMSYPGFAHYLVPVVPFLSIITAAFIYLFFQRATFRYKRALIIIVLYICLIPCFFNILRFNVLMRHLDTRTIAKSWVENNIPDNSTIMSEGYILTEAIQAPPLEGTLETLKRDLTLVKSMGGKGNIIEQRIEKAEEMRGAAKRFNIYKASDLDAETLNKIKPEYIITNGYIDMNAGEREYLKEKKLLKRRKDFFNALHKKYELIEDFKPYPKLGGYFPLLLIEDFKKIESISLLKDFSKLSQGPEIRIYRIKNNQKI